MPALAKGENKHVTLAEHLPAKSEPPIHMESPAIESCVIRCVKALVASR